MKTIQSLLAATSLFTILLLTSCSTAKQSFTPEHMIIGKWVVQSVNVGGEIVPASLLGREIAFEFKSDGTTTFTTPSGTSEDGLYAVRKGKIYDLESPTEVPVDILELTRELLVISMIEEGERLEMTLVSTN